MGKTKKTFYNPSIIFSLAVSVSLILSAYAVSASQHEPYRKAKENFQFPVAELGNCTSADDCKLYCNKDENIPKCVRFSIKNNLLTKEQAEDGERLLALLNESGIPGKCKDAPECFVYCESVASTEECLDYALRHNLIPQGVSVEEVRQFARLQKEGVKFPGNCTRKDECLAYCENPAHISECVGFAEKAGFISKEEAAEARRFAPYIVKGETPGKCARKAECEAYCENSAHIDECIVFAERVGGIMSSEELTEAKKVAPFIKRGETPGGCKSKTECEDYCANDVHFEECISFAEKAGFVDAKEAEFAKKFKGKSPGDCAKGVRSAAEARRACSEFCNNPVNQPVCFQFAVEAGIMKAEEATQMGSLSDFQACVPQAPQEIQQCFIDNLGPDLFEAMKQGVLPLEGDIEEMIKKIREARACVNRYADDSLQIFTDDPDALACINSELGADYLKRASRGEVSCGDAAPVQKRVESCIEKTLGTKIDRCFSLACSEATTCIQNLQKGFRGAEIKREGGPKLEVFAKLEQKINMCIAEDIRVCLTKDCGEAIECVERFQSGAKEEKQEGKLDPALEAEITAKFTACAKQGQGEPSSRSAQPQTPEYKTQEYPQYPQGSGGSSYEIPITSELCANFSNVPACSYAGSPDSQNYQLCKKCFPDR